MKRFCFLTLLLLLASTVPLASGEGLDLEVGLSNEISEGIETADDDLGGRASLDGSGEPVLRGKSMIDHTDDDGDDDDDKDDKDDDKKNLDEERPVVPRLTYAPECPPEVICQTGELCTMHANFPSCYDPQRACIYLECQHGGTCHNYKCICLPGFTGPLCQHELPRCPLGYCINGGTCSVDPYSYSYSCKCAFGYRGTRCEAKIPDAPVCNLVCYNQGTCVINHYDVPTCKCAFGYRGTRCEAKIPDAPVCNLVCYNQGTCVINHYDVPTCKCPFGYRGTHCEAKIPDAPVCNLVCYNQGTCVINHYDVPTCVCISGYTGDHCQNPPASTCNLPCLNGGTCNLNIYGQARCVCQTGYTGDSCQNSPAPTCNLPCLNGGTCNVDVYGQARCICLTGYTGDSCQIPPTPCNLPCLNGGSCYIDMYGAASCHCVAPWTGPTCATLAPPDDDVCNAVNCENDCICQESCRHADGYVCASSSGFLGRHCNIPIPELHCTANEIVISVSQLFYAEWDMNQANSVIYMSPTVDGIGSTLPQCRAQLVGSTYRIAVSHPFTQCGTQTATDVGPDGFNRVSFTNALWINKNFGSSTFSYDMPFGIVRFQCVYANTYTIYTSIRPIMDEPPIISDELEYQISATLCKVSTCNEPCPAPLTVQQSAVYTVGQMIHLDFGISHFTNAVLNLPAGAATFIQHVVLSCSPSTLFNTVGSNGQVISTQDSPFPLFQNGCPTEHGVALQAVMGVSTLDHRACFSFRLPRSRVCTELYIHVRLHVCAGVFQQITCPNGFSTGSRCSLSRRKRSASDVTAGDVVARPVVIGPIYTLEEEEGEGHVTFLLDGAELRIKQRNGTVFKVKKPVPLPPLDVAPITPQTSTDLGVVLFAAAICISIIVLGLAAVLLFLRRRPIKPESLGL